MKAFPQPIPRIARAALVVPALVVFAVTLMLARAAAPPAAKVLVVNSDASVAKYVEVQDAFKETLGAGRVTEVDFAKVRWRRTPASSTASAATPTRRQLSWRRASRSS